MKIGGVEGTPEEIKNTFENHGLRIEDYLVKPDTPLSNVWVAIPAIGLILTVISQVLFAPMGHKAVLLHFLGGLGLLLWLALSVQLRFKNPWAAGAVGIGGAIILSVAAGFIEPKDTADIVKHITR